MWRLRIGLVTQSPGGSGHPLRLREKPGAKNRRDEALRGERPDRKGRDTPRKRVPDQYVRQRGLASPGASRRFVPLFSRVKRDGDRAPKPRPGAMTHVCNTRTV